MATLAWAGELVTGERFAAGADGVKRVALGGGAAASLGPVDLDHPLAMGEQEAGQARAVAAGALQRPAATTSSVLAGDLQQLLVAGLAACDLQLRQQPAVGGQDRSAWLSRWVSTPMTASTLPSSMGTAVVSSSKSGDRGRHRPGCESPSGRTVRGHDQGSDRL